MNSSLEKINFFKTYEQLHDLLPENILEKIDSKNGNLTESILEKWENQRPILLVKSTSYTFDEKIDQLFVAMFNYDKFAQEISKSSDQQPRKIKLVITGSGPRKQYFKDLVLVNKHKWKFISIEMIWFLADDYPKILAASDVGVCLHYSSSGLDTPMKIIDMYGACLPCLAAKYPW